MNAFHETREYGPDIPVNVLYRIDNNFLAHWHIDVEMVYILEGCIRIGVNKESKILRKGEMAIFSSKDIHYYDSRDMHSIIIALIFHPEIIGSPRGWPENQRFNEPYIDKELFKNLDEQTHSSIVETFQIILKEIDEKKTFYSLYVKGRISELCALALRHFPIYDVIFSKESHKPSNIQKIQYAIQYLENNYMNEISLSDISEKANFSPCYFSRLFNSFTGINFKSYLSKVKIDKAENLIKTSDKSIIDISYECGFNSIRTFNRIFKSAKGCQPSDIRKAVSSLAAHGTNGTF